jgi:hypothetical protein
MRFILISPSFRLPMILLAAEAQAISLSAYDRRTVYVQALQAIG